MGLAATSRGDSRSDGAIKDYCFFYNADGSSASVAGGPRQCLSQRPPDTNAGRRRSSGTDHERPGHLFLPNAGYTLSVAATSHLWHGPCTSSYPRQAASPFRLHTPSGPALVARTMCAQTDSFGWTLHRVFAIMQK